MSNIKNIAVIICAIVIMIAGYLYILDTIDNAYNKGYNSAKIACQAQAMESSSYIGTSLEFIEKQNKEIISLIMDVCRKAKRERVACYDALEHAGI